MFLFNRLGKCLKIGIVTFFGILLISSIFLPHSNSITTANEGKQIISRHFPKAPSLFDIKLSPKIHQTNAQEFGSVIRNLQTRGSRDIAFSPTGRFLASVGSNLWPEGIYLEGGMIELWDLKSGTMRLLLSGHDYNTIESVAFSPDEQLLVAGGEWENIYLFNVADGTLMNTFPESINYDFQHVLFSRDGSEIIASGTKGSYERLPVLTFWDVSSGELKNEFPLPYGQSRDIAISPDGTLLATGANLTYGHVQLWNLTTPELTLVHTFIGHNRLVRSLDFSPDGSLLASGSYDETVRVWNVTNLTELSASPLVGHVGHVLSVKFSPRGDMLVSADGSDSLMNHRINFWDTTSWANFHKIDLLTTAQFLAFFPTGDILARSSYHIGTELLNVDRTQIEVQKLSNHTSPVTDLAFGSNGTIIASVDANAHLKLWNMTTNQVFANFTGPTPTALGTSLDLSPDGQWLVAGSSDKIIRIWNVSSGQVQTTLTEHASSVNSVAFSPNGLWLASGDIAGTIKLWNVTDPNAITLHFDLPSQSTLVTALAFSHNSDMLASGSSEASVFLWNLTTGKISSSFPGHKARITALTFFPNDTSIISGSWDGTVKIWTIPIGIKEVELVHPTAINTLDYSPDGDLIATGGSDNLVRIWNASTGVLLSLIQVQREEVFSLKFLPNTLNLAVGNGLNVFLYEVDPLSSDSDKDGMSDSWEVRNNLNPLDSSDGFRDQEGDGLVNCLEFFLETNASSHDSDGDDLPDKWEYIHHTNPVGRDSYGDIDNDHILNWYEYQMGLNSYMNDSASDLDGDSLTNLQEYLYGSWANQTDSDLDGMPDWYEYQSTRDRFNRLDPLENDSEWDMDGDGMLNLYEYQNGFDAGNPDDGFIDSDGDSFRNIDEYLEGTNPRDFWDFPFTRLSTPLILLIFLVFLGVSTGIVTFFYRKRRQTKWIIKLHAPDYSTAVRIRNANLPDYSALVDADEKATKELNEATMFYYQGQYSAATERYLKVSEAGRLLGLPRLLVEADLRLVLLTQKTGTLTTDHVSFQRIPPSPHADPFVEAFTHMLHAVLAEVNNNWGAAKKAWNGALLSETLPPDYRMVCQEALVETAFRTWFYDQSDSSEIQVNTLVEEWQGTCEISEHSGSLCPVFLFRARFALASYQYNKVEQWLERCLQEAEESNLSFYQDKAHEAQNQLTQHKERIETLAEAEGFLSPTEKGKLVQQYIRRAVKIMGEDHKA